MPLSATLRLGRTWRNADDAGISSTAPGCVALARASAARKLVGAAALGGPALGGPAALDGLVGALGGPAG